MTSKAIVTAILLGIASVAPGADTITFSESLSDRLATYRDREIDETYTELIRTVSGSVRATITLPGLGQQSLRDFTTWTLELGGYSFTEDFSNADQLNDNKAVFIAYEYDYDREYEIGRLTLTRSGDTLTVAANSSYLEEGSFVATSLAEESEETGDVAGNVPFHFALDDLSFERELYFKGKQKVSYRTVADEEYALYNIQVSGEADSVKPAISISTPKKALRATSETTLVRGRATDAHGIGELELLVNDEPVAVDEFDEETGDWSALVELQPGMNRIVAACMDFSGNEATAQVDVQRVVVSALSLTQTVGGTVTGVIPGQMLEVGQTYKAVAQPAAGHLLHHWRVGDDTRSGDKLQFVMETGLTIHAEFVTNKFLAARGTYEGLFQPVAPDGGGDAPFLTPTNCGHVTLTLTDKGRVTGKLSMGGGKISLSGSCDADGHLSLELQPKGMPALQLDVQFQLNGAIGGASGYVISTHGTFALAATRPLDPTEAASVDGPRTFVIPGAAAESSAVLPSGNGAGTLTFKRGVVKLSGNLGDGTAITYAGALSQDGRFPLYLSLERGKKIVLGWIDAAGVTQDSYPNVVAWLKSPASSDKLYPAGFQTLSTFLHAPCAPLARGDSGLGWTNGVVLIDGGNLSATITNRVQITGANAQLQDGNPARIVLKLKPATGLFTGSFIHPATQKSVTVKGAWLQGTEASPAQGGGWFTGGTESGYVEFVPMMME